VTVADYRNEISMASAGSVSALWSLFASTVSRTYFTALNIAGRNAAAEAAARTYRLAFDNLGRLDYPEAFPVWLDRLAVYIAYDAAREAGGEEPEACGGIVAFLRDFHKMSDREIAGLMKTETGSLPAASASAPRAESFLIEPDTAMEIWRRTREDGRSAAGTGAEPERGETAAAASGSEEELVTIPLLANEYLRRKKRAGARRIAAACAALCVAAGVAAVSLFGPGGRIAARNASDETAGSAGSEAQVQRIADVLSSQLSGQVGEIYALSDDTYYVSINLGTQTREDTGTFYGEQDNSIRIAVPGGYTRSDGSAGEPEEKAIQVLFAPAGDGPESDYTGQANGSSAPSGEGGQDAAESGTVSRIVGSPLPGRSARGRAGLEGGPDGFSIMLRINCLNVDISRPITLILDPTITQAVGEAGGVQIVLNDMQHCIELSREQLVSLCDAYGSVTLQFFASGPRRYDIAFHTDGGERITELFGTMTFTLPADGPMTYVFATYDGGTESRGGVYDRENGTITFPVSLSGIYEIIGSEREIADVAAMDAETAKAAQFLVSLQFLQLDRSGNFRPEDVMSRNEVVNAVGRMFLATDDSLTSSFSDVELTDPAHDYISFGITSSILTGEGDGTFRGEETASREEALTICGRTLAYRFGEELPGDAGAQLDFEDAQEIAEYARGAVTLMVGEGVLDAGGRLRPRDAVTRGEAAVWLYRMYCGLYGYTEY